MTAVQSFGMLLIRSIVGVVMIFHGAQKLFGWFEGRGMEAFTNSVAGLGLPGGIPPLYLAYAAAIAEFGGGILLIIGLLTPLAALGVAVTMGVAAIMVHGEAFSLKHDGMEFALTLGVVSLGILLIGPGRFSLDAAMPWRIGVTKAKAKP